MTTVAGIDGIKGGWVVVLKRRREVVVKSATTFAQALGLCDGVAVIGVDMPIGLPATAARGGRACDREARKVLGPKKGPCVFPTPCRQALLAECFHEANEISRASSQANIGISKQSFAIFGKLREVDDELVPALQQRVREVHPELSFTALRDQFARHEKSLAFLAPKKKLKGREQREQLLQLGGFDDLTSLIATGKAVGAAPDDTLDACAAACTAELIVQGRERTLPSAPPVDGMGLRMEICW